jgi:hypothetical protein
MLSVLALLFAVSFVNVGIAQAGVASGQVVTCPAGDPIQDFPVKIYVNGSYRTTVTTNTSGVWTYDITFEDCPLAILTAIIGTSLHTPYVKKYCPLGRHGTGDPCCVQVVHAIPCSGNIVLDDLELRCGYAGAPPCPTVE